MDWVEDGWCVESVLVEVKVKRRMLKTRDGWLSTVAYLVRGVEGGRSY